MSVHARLAACALFVAPWASALAQADGAAWAPTSRDLARYEHIWQASPFVMATEVTPKAESIAQRYTVTGYATLAGNDVVFLFDRKTLSRFTVSTSSAQNGVELISVTEKDDARRLSARIRAAGEVAEVTYDASVADAGASPDASANNQPRTVNNTPMIPNRPNPNQTANGQQNAQQGRSGGPPRPVRVIRRAPISPQ